jgi:hypothetical protein
MLLALEMMKDLTATNQNTSLKKYTSILSTLACLLSISLFAQNLVPNGSFEQGTNCPTFIGNLEEECLFWYHSINGQDGENITPEWYHECSTADALSPPNTAFGYQIPLDGEAYAGLVCYNTTPTSQVNYREIVGVELVEQLETGNPYLLEFALNRHFSGATGISSNNFGFKLTTFPHFNGSDEAVDNNSFFKIDSIVTDTLNWIEVEVEFIADSNYRYLHFGNFYDIDNTSVIVENELSTFSYYALDRISLSSVLNEKHSIQSREVRVYPNPTDSFTSIDFASYIEKGNLKIINSEGSVIIEKELTRLDSYTLDLTMLNAGLYTIQVQTLNTLYNERIIKF